MARTIARTYPLHIMQVLQPYRVSMQIQCSFIDSLHIESEFSLWFEFAALIVIPDSNNIGWGSA